MLRGQNEGGVYPIQDIAKWKPVSYPSSDFAWHRDTITKISSSIYRREVDNNVTRELLPFWKIEEEVMTLRCERPV